MIKILKKTQFGQIDDCCTKKIATSMLIEQKSSDDIVAFLQTSYPNISITNQVAVVL